jgi:hypothetical protein
VDAAVEFSAGRNGVESYPGNFLGLEDIMANEKDCCPCRPVPGLP